MRKFLIIVSPILLLFHIAIIVYRFHISPNETGEIGRLGKIAFGKKYDQAISDNYLAELMVDQLDGGTQISTYDIITIGDSFSGQGIYGYQNYLAHSVNKTILNIPALGNLNIPAPGERSPLQTAIALLNNKFLLKFSPKVIIVESVERYFIDRFTQLDLSKQISTKEFYAALEKTQDRTKKIRKTDLLYETLSWLRLSIGYNNPIRKAKLTSQLFSTSNNYHSNHLYFYFEDLKRSDLSKEEFNIANKAMEDAYNLFKANNIQFIYIVAADKYDVYEPFIKNNPYPINKTLDYFSSLDSTSYFINTKSILQPLVEKGIKDIYLVNDTHWSYIASQELAKKLNEIINL